MKRIPYITINTFTKLQSHIYNILEVITVAILPKYEFFNFSHVTQQVITSSLTLGMDSIFFQNVPNKFSQTPSKFHPKIPIRSRVIKKNRLGGGWYHPPSTYEGLI